MEALVSFIIPVYNVEKYLGRCVNSVIAQSYKNMEIILVDDGSTDSSGQICDHWAKEDSRIKVIHKKNGGLADARNAGIDIAKGELITFLDSDDSVERTYVEYMHRIMQDTHSDIACCNINVIKEGETKKEINKDKEIKLKFQNSEAIEYMLYDKYLTNSANLKLYKRILFKEIRYPKGKVFEDMFTTYKVIALSDKVVYGSEKLYNYYLRNDSILGSGLNEKKQKDLMQASNDILEFVNNNMPEVQKAAEYRMTMSAITVIGSLSKEELKGEKKYVDDIWKIITSNRRRMIFNRKVTKKFKLLLLISYLGKNNLYTFYSKFVN